MACCNSTAKNPVNWFEINTTDIERAKKFYATVLNTTFMDCPMHTGDKMSFFAGSEDCNAPNAMGCLVQHNFSKPGGNSVVVYFQCEDCQVEQDRVEAAGGKVAVPKFSIGENGFCAICIDTEGNAFGLHSMK